jgi:tetratricopeptide (TPR) repeat protein
MHAATKVTIGLALVGLASWFLVTRRAGSGREEPAEERGWFEDRTARAGVDAPHQNRVFDNPYAEIMQGYTALGATASVADVDGDGFEDVYFTVSNDRGLNRLYRNEGDFTFTDIAVEAGVAQGNDARNASALSLFCDFDNDGDPDLVLVRFGQTLLFENQRSATGELAFEEVSTAAGIAPRRLNSIEAICFDADRDGDLDLFLANYFAPVDLFDPETPRFFPESFETARNGGGVTYYRNLWADEGRLTFVDATAEAGLGEISGWMLDLGHGDADHDGDDDLYLAADFGTDHFLRNDGGVFLDVSADTIGVDTKKGMNVEWGDFDRDGWLDIYVTNITDEYMNEGNFLWHNDGGRGFVDVAREVGARDTGWGWAGKFLDYDNNGWLDLMVANGWVSGSRDPADNYVKDIFEIIQDPSIDLADARSWPPIGTKSLSGYQRNVLFRNDHGTYVDVADRHGLDAELDSRGIAVADFDRDGRPDLFVTNAGKPPQLWRNVQPTGRPAIGLELEGRESNRDAVGARVWIVADGRAQLDFVDGGNGFASTSSKRLHFGLDRAERVEALVVVWPSGLRQEFADLPVGRHYRLIEGQATLLGGPAPIPERRRAQAVTAPPEVWTRFAAVAIATDDAGSALPDLGEGAEGAAGLAPYREGVDAFARGEAEVAISRLERALELEPNNLRFGADYRQVIITSSGRDRAGYQRALRFLGELSERQPDAPNLLLNLAFAHVDRIPLEGAITQVIQANTALGLFTRALEVEESWLGRYSRGNALLFWPPIFGRVPAAISDLEHAIALAANEPARPYHGRAWAALGDAHWRLGDVDRAVQIWRDGATRYPEDPELTTRLQHHARSTLEAFFEDRFDPNRGVATDLGEIFGTPTTVVDTPAVLGGRARSADTAVRFEEVSQAAGINFIHRTRRFGGPKAEVLEMFTHGGAAVAVGDYDGDGDDDLFVTDSALGAQNRLWRNDSPIGGPVRFVEVEGALGLSGGNDAHAIVADALWLDYNNDGNLDLYVGRFGAPLLYRNLGGSPPRFEEIAQAVGLDLFGNTIGTVAFDADGDGYLDLMLANYFAPIDLTRLETSSVLPNDLDRADNGGGVTFYRNVALPDGGRGFRDETRRAGLADLRGWSLDIGHADLDDDGFQDVYVAGDFGTDRVLWGRGDGTFEDSTSASLGGFDTRKGMNVDMGDPDRDGRLDIYVTNITDDYMKECNFFWHNLGGRKFLDVSRENGTCDTDWGWAAKFGDWDNDGWEDLFVVNGLRSRDPERDYIPLLLDTTILKPGVDFSRLESYPDIGTMSWSGYQKQRLFHNAGDGTFVEIGRLAGVDNDLDGRGIGVGDFDRDGRLDFYQSNVDQQALLYQGASTTRHHWLGVRLVGTRSNRNAIGARIRVEAAGGTLIREVNGGNGYASASSLTAHFGLGASNRVDVVEVRWPSGTVERFPVAGVDRILALVEEEGQ